MTSTSSVTFTPDDWDDAQTVTVTAVDDDVIEGTHSSTISHSASSADNDYNGIAISDVIVNIRDDEVAPLKVITGVAKGVRRYDAPEPPPYPFEYREVTFPESFLLTGRGSQRQLRRKWYR